ncbi:endoribonuclease MazF [Allochromatium humboldtianum]|jgi:mRNA interferase MazF|uniref:Endoribonuclease MazF n=1 Tax=Allochromatium humboldtianum TaxID=504901 RepID=A0A850R6T6_9GAMM|nr:endoribonuclease MazF [Allochromatium humboldtianum]NVZ08096.1 endoribonuclease MazF [Allochromatium humboldtianum]
MATTYVPDEGDIVWLSFTPHSGHEQAGRRPAVVLSPRAYNSRAGLLVCVPITNQAKGYPFEVVLGGRGATGVALADQVKSLDWQSRQAERKGQVGPAELAEIKAKIRTLLKLV